MPESPRETKRILTLISLIIAGEAIFFLPFVLPRIFRPIVLSVFHISNTELGAYFSAYGIVAMASYVFGGILADRFPARNLMAVALWLTSVGGFIMAGVPSTKLMVILYAFWGFTTIFIFWAALIRATRQWGGQYFQGRAFGWLEGGRGGTAAIMGTIAFIIFSWVTPGKSSTAVEGQGFHPFQVVILVISGITLLSGLLIWFLVPGTPASAGEQPALMSFKKVLILARMPTVWLLAIMIVCAYVGYKITDDFSLYAREVLGFSEVGSAGTGTAALWLRAGVAIAAGYLGDRLNRIRVIISCFGLTLFAGLLIGTGILTGAAGLVLLNLSLTAAGIYGVRALYFAIMKEVRVPFGLTGTAVGIVSFVGFTPEVFMGPWMGHLLDKYPGETGHQYVFIVLAGFALAGLLTGLLVRYKEKEAI
jgi:sugar phosphate permease